MICWMRTGGRMKMRGMNMKIGVVDDNGYDGCWVLFMGADG